MQIIDWRPWAERYLTSLWRGQIGSGGPRSSLAGDLAAALQERVMTRRIGRRDPVPAGMLVVSIGNLALGGTGKTPVTSRLAQDLAALGHRGIILTRGFGSAAAGPLFVEGENREAGDEARLMAGDLADTTWRVVQARDRRAGLRHIVEAGCQPGVVLVEDGHQTADVGRDLDVVILDHWCVQTTSSEPRVAPVTGSVFPFGPWREAAPGADRAAVWLLETTEPVPLLGSGGQRVLTFSRKVGLRPANDSARRQGSLERPGLVSGLARPAGFEAGASKLLPAEIGLALRLSDHVDYREELIRRMTDRFTEAGCDGLVTTAKDWVKLAPLWGEKSPAFVVDLTITWGQPETLADMIDERL